MLNLAFIDCETLGLILDEHPVWEVSYALDEGPIQTFLLPHSMKTYDPEALALNGYAERFDPHKVAYDSDIWIQRALKGRTLVGSNPAFDAYRLEYRWGWGSAPWHYGLLDVKCYAMAYMQMSTPPSLSAIAANLRGDGFKIPEPDHSSAGDVETVRQTFYALRLIYSIRS